MEWKKTGFVFAIFIILFYLLNLLPLIDVKYDVGPLDNPISKTCSLNYLTCINTRFGDNFPTYFQHEIIYLFVLPILLPIALTWLIIHFLLSKIFKKIK